MYKTVKIEDAIGLVLGHDVTEIRKNEFKGRAFKKGHRIETADICHFQRLGKEHIFVLEIDENQLHENDAALAMAKAFCGAGVGFQSEPKEGKLNLIARRDGLLKVRVDALTDINMLGEIMCASRHSNTLVKAGDTVAGTRAIPLTVEKAVVAEAVRIAESIDGLFEVKPLRRARTGLVITGNEVFTRLIEDRFEEVLRTKIDQIGSTVIGVAFAPDNPSIIATEIQRLISQGADLILTTGGMSVDPDDVTDEDRADIAAARTVDDVVLARENTLNDREGTSTGARRRTGHGQVADLKPDDRKYPVAEKRHQHGPGFPFLCRATVGVHDLNIDVGAVNVQRALFARTPQRAAVSAAVLVEHPRMQRLGEQVLRILGQGPGRGNDGCEIGERAVMGSGILYELLERIYIGNDVVFRALLKQFDVPADLGVFHLKRVEEFFPPQKGHGPLGEGLLRFVQVFDGTP